MAFDPDAFLGEKPPEPAPAPPPPPAAPAFNPDTFLGAKPQEKPAEMPGVIDAMLAGIGAGARGVKQTLSINSTAPQQEHPESPAAQPFAWGDVTSPVSQGLPKIAYRLGEGAPTLATGVAGGVAGGLAAGPPGAIAGGATGAALGTVLQSVGPIFQEELKRTPQDPDGAWDRTTKQAAAGGLFSAAGWAAFPLRIASGPLKQMAFQALGVQPGISVAHKATTNAITGQPLSEGLGEAYTSGAVMTGVPAVGHAVVKAALGNKAAPSTPLPPEHQAIADRLTDSGNPTKFKTFDDAYTAIKDDLNPIKVMERLAAEMGHTPGSFEQRPYEAARLVRGASGKSTHFIEHGTFDIDGNETGAGLRQVLAPVKDNIDRFQVYLTARRALELHGRGIDTGIPQREALAVVTQDRHQFEPVARDINRYQSELLHYLKDSGVLNEEQVHAMQQLNRDYVPFYRLMDEGKSGPAGAGGGLKVKNPVKRIEGSEREIINPLESIIKNTHLFVELAERNRARQKMVEMFEATPNGDRVLKKIANNAPVELSQAEMHNLLTQSGIPAGLQVPPSTFTVFRPKSMQPGGDQFAVFRNGKRELWQAPPEVVKAYEGLDAQSIGAIQKVLATPAKLLRAGVTLAPDFFVRNMIRDQLTAFAFSKNGYIPMWDFMKGMRQVMGAEYGNWLNSRGASNAALDAVAGVLGKGEGFKEWLRSGGANAALVSGERDYIANEVRRLTKNGDFQNMKGMLTNPINFLQATSELMESGTRIGDFMKARAKGKSLPEAGFESREVTLDFWRIGAKMRAMNNIVAFLNANMEGLDRAARALKDPDSRMPTMAKIIGGITMPSMMLAWANQGDKRLEELPGWERDFFWNIPTDKWVPISEADYNATPEYLRRKNAQGQFERNEGTIYKIPKNFEIGLIAGSVPERMMDQFLREKPDAWHKVGKSFQRAFMMEPSTYVPTFASPLIEQMTNYSMFGERPLVPKPLQEIQKQEQYLPNTTEPAKLAGKGLEKIFGQTSFASPIVIENYVRAWTGSLGTQALRMADNVLKKTGVVDPPPEATATPADKFFQRAFVARYPSSGAESIQKFYETYNERKANKNTVSFLSKRAGRGDEAAEFQRNNPMVQGEQFYKALSNMQKYIRQVQLDRTMTPDQKRLAMDNTYFQMIEIAKAGNQLFRTTKTPPKEE